MTDEITQSEKREVLKDTFLSRAQADAELEAQGRFKRTPNKVEGVPTYPTLPASSPFAKSLDEITGPEPPLGFAVDERDPGADDPGNSSEPSFLDCPSPAVEGPHGSLTFSKQRRSI